MKKNSKIISIDDNKVGQRIDNFLMTQLKGIPKSRIYRAIRKGEVRVNKGRVQADYRIQLGDEIRIPPLVSAEAKPISPPSKQLAETLEKHILLENQEIIIIDKPSGMPVHGGTQVSAGLIEMLRLMRPRQKSLELVHRLDKDTSGCLIIAKKHSVLVELHRLLTLQQMQKQYLLLVKGVWKGGARKVTAPLKKNYLSSGERIVVVSDQGKQATTLFKPLKIFKNCSLLLAKPLTGRTHQIRVHAKHIGFPIAGDPKYGDDYFNQEMKRFKLKRLFLHSASIECELTTPIHQQIGICSRLPRELLHFLNKLTLISKVSKIA